MSSGYTHPYRCLTCGTIFYSSRAYEFGRKCPDDDGGLVPYETKFQQKKMRKIEAESHN